MKAWLLALLCVLPLACREAPRGLVVANGDDVSQLHPQRAASIADVRVLQAMHAGLTRLDPATLQPEPGLASHFEASADFRRWSFTLRDGLRWSDGEALTAEDVVRSWQQLRQAEFGSPYRAWLVDADLGAEGNQLWVELPRPTPAFAEMCAFPAMAPVPAHAEAEKVGCGPYRLVLRKVRDRIAVEKNPHYWDAASVTLPAIDFLTVESQVTALNLFLAGDVAYAPNAPELAVQALLETHADSFEPTPQFATTFLRFQCDTPPFDSVELRRRFSSAVDPEALQRTLGGVRQPTHHFVPDGIPGWTPAPLPKWKGRAQASADALPSPSGGFEYLYNSSELNRDVAEVLQEQWKQALGVRVRLGNMEWKSFLAAQRGLEYQISRSSWIGDYLDPLSFLEIFESGSGNNRTGWSDEVFDYLIESARQEESPKARMTLLHEAERRLLDQAVIVPLYHEVSLELVSPRLKGFHRNLRGYIDWGRLHWEAEASP